MMGQAPDWARGPHTDILHGVDVRLSTDGTIDEILCDRPVRFHLERIGEGQCWIGLTLADGRTQKIMLERHDNGMYVSVNT